jgi:WD40 repeat protein
MVLRFTMVDKSDFSPNRLTTLAKSGTSQVCLCKMQNRREKDNQGKKEITMSDDGNEAKRVGFNSIRRIETNQPFGAGFTYHMRSTRVVAISPDGKWLAFGGWDETVQVCELVAGGRGWTYRGHQNGSVCAIAWSPDGTFLASASRDETTADLMVWDAFTGKTLSRVQSNEVGPDYTVWSIERLDQRLPSSTPVGLL